MLADFQALHGDLQVLNSQGILGSDVEVALLGTEGLALRVLELIQSLWSGCGLVARVWVEGRGAEGAGASEEKSVVIKHVKMPTRIEHPRGWNTDRSAQRKVWAQV